MRDKKSTTTDEEGKCCLAALCANEDVNISLPPYACFRKIVLKIVKIIEFQFDAYSHGCK